MAERRIDPYDGVAPQHHHQDQFDVRPVLRPLAQSERGEWVCLTAAADGQICALFATLLRYTWEEFSAYYTGKLLG